ncbi:hypothetical protein CTM97_21720 [Photobacterium phosphoreum]|uniref:Uncharacterized protein n=1 Tax=Photobacterium phosphoreum TaxID=659 RepID=A0A2T3J9Y5_PHOPO|nr:hypothetical protein [Photobacterium phosphoreum]PSU19599.1 hypothetical protein CTM96_20905 [Photobacterium phosphoreum]PSU34521.1 hypothetical protein CTM97_21720 [Photobacterium phosphoreum]PSU45599.1 hypothetical protein C9J18_21680 [Photobacterium phosphoreum]
MKNVDDLEKIITISSRVVAKRCGMNVVVAKNVLQLGTETTRANATLFHHQQLPKKLENM